MGAPVLVVVVVAVFLVCADVHGKSTPPMSPSVGNSPAPGCVGEDEVPNCTDPTPEDEDPERALHLYDDEEDCEGVSDDCDKQGRSKRGKRDVGDMVRERARRTKKKKFAKKKMRWSRRDEEGCEGKKRAGDGVKRHPSRECSCGVTPAPITDNDREDFKDVTTGGHQGDDEATLDAHAHTDTSMSGDDEATLDAHAHTDTSMSGDDKAHAQTTSPLNVRSENCSTGVFYRTGCEACYCFEPPYIADPNTTRHILCLSVFKHKEECLRVAPAMHCDVTRLQYGYEERCEGRCTCDPDRLITVCERLPCGDPVLESAGYYQGKPRGDPPTKRLSYHSWIRRLEKEKRKRKNKKRTTTTPTPTTSTNTNRKKTKKKKSCKKTINKIHSTTTTTWRPTKIPV